MLKVLILILCLHSFGCGRSFKKAIEEENLPEPTVTAGFVEDTQGEDPVIIKLIEFDLDLKKDTLIEADVVELLDEIQVLTNGHRLELKAQKVKFSNNTVTSFRTFWTSCDQNGSSSKDVFLNADVIEGEVFFNLKGKNAGIHCKTHFSHMGEPARWCMDNFDSQKECFEKMYQNKKPFNGGNSGNLVYKNDSVILDFDYELDQSATTGTPATRLSFNKKEKVVPKGRIGQRSKVCALLNGVSVCE